MRIELGRAIVEAVDDEPIWCAECLAKLPWKHKHVSFCRLYRAANWLASVLAHLAGWIAGWGAYAQVRANRRAGLDVYR